MTALVELWNGIIVVLTSILDFFYSFTNDYGVAIILLTVLTRLVMLPLTIKQTRSMQQMQELQPRLKELQQKYKKDREKLQEEMMKLYSENKVNPFGGCLPMILQLPIMFALFRMLLTNEEIQSATFVGLFNLGTSAGDLGLAVEAIPYLVLIVLMVVTTYIPQRMMSKESQQQRIMLFMTVFMAWIAWRLPSGVLVYWVTTNVWTVGQQWIMFRPGQKEEQKGAASA